MKVKYLSLVVKSITILVITVTCSFAKADFYKFIDNLKGQVSQGVLPPLRMIMVRNTGAFVLRIKYFEYKSDGSCCNVVKKDLSSSQIGGGVFFDAPEGSEVYLHAIAVGGWTKCATIGESANIRCSRGTLNMHCYYTDGTHGHIRGIRHGGCAFPHLYFTDKINGCTLYKNVTLNPGSEGDIYLYNDGATGANKLRIFFDDAKGEKTSKILTAYFKEKSTCNKLNTLKNGKGCILHYRIPANPEKGVGDFEIISDADHLYHKESLAVHVATPGFLVFQDNGKNIASQSLGSADTGSFRIKNIGEMPVDNFKLNFYDNHGKLNKSFASYFSGSCLQTRQIVSNDTCTLTYSIPVRPETGSFNIIAKGSQLFGKTTLPLTVSLRGHLVFAQDDQVIDELPVVSGSHGSLSIKNIGALPVSGLHLEFVNGANQKAGLFGTYFRDNCRDGDTLSPGEHCDLSYAIPEGAKLDLSYMVKANGQVKSERDARLFMPIRGSYIGYGGHAAAQVDFCRMNTNGMLIDCESALDSDNAKLLGLVFDIKLQRQGVATRAYLVSEKERHNSVLSCDVDSVTGKLTHCHDTGVTGFRSTRKIAFSPDGSRVYIGNFGTYASPGLHPYIILCDVLGKTGLFENCHDSGARIPDPLFFEFTQSTVMNPEGDRLYAVYENQGYKILTCKVNEPYGNLTDCETASRFKDRFAQYRPYDITFLKGKSYAYIPYFSRNGVDLCQLDVNGFLTGCHNSGAKKMSYPATVIANPHFGRVYILNSVFGKYTKIITCESDENGYLSMCQPTGKNRAFPKALAFYPSANTTKP